MAAISWLVDGMQVTEAQAAALVGEGRTVGQRMYAEQFGIALTGGVPPEVQLVPLPTNSQAPTAINPDFAVFATGLPGHVGVHRVEPWGLIPIGTNNLVDAFQKGYRFIDGKWIDTAVAQPPVPLGIPTATTVPSGTTIVTAGGGRPLAAVATPFVGGPMQGIRMTTGVGAEGGALTPIRFGMFAAALPRIVMDEIST